jgi:hypothetical protein
MTTAPSLEDLGFTGPELMTASDQPRTLRLTRGQYRRSMIGPGAIGIDADTRCCSRVAADPLVGR